MALPPSSRYAADIDGPSAEDSLGRRTFASRLASLITRWNGDKSLIVGLFGEWGAGKTTVKNFTLETLKAMPDDCRPIVVEFNPWEWDGPRALRAAFFAEIGKELLIEDARTADVGKRLTNYAGVLSVSSSIVASAETIASYITPAAAPFVGIIREFLERSSGVVEKGSAVHEPDAKSLAKTKADVALAMRGLTRNVLVIIDDVDRLTSAEIGQLFQLIKANGDFPRTVYIVLCDRAAVESALGDLVKGRGREFLEKVINVAFDLPRSSNVVIEKVLTEELIALLCEFGVSDRFDRLRWQDAFDEALIDVMTTLRDVKRYLATIEFTIADLASNWKNDFDVVDFLLVEALRVFFPDVYLNVVDAKLRLTGVVRFAKGEEPTRAAKDPKQATIAFLDGLVEPVMERDLRRAARAIVVDLFPSLRAGSWVFGRSTGRAAPVANSSSFDRYFFFGMQASDLTAERRAEILYSRSSHARMLQLLREAREHGWLSDLMLTLQAAADDKLGDPAALLTAIADFMDECPEDVSVGRYTADSELVRLAWNVLEHLGEPERSSTYLQLFQDAAGVRRLCRLCPDDGKEADFIVGQTTIDAAQTALADKLRTKGAELLALDDASYILSVAQQGVAPELASEIARAALMDSGAALRLLRAFVYRQIIEVGRPRKRHGDIKLLPELKKFVDLESLLNVIRRAPAPDLTPDDRNAVALLEAALEEAVRNFGAEASSVEMSETDPGP